MRIKLTNFLILNHKVGRRLRNAYAHDSERADILHIFTVAGSLPSPSKNTI